nr:HpcH/HpaI aldolase/citrate lyase family protein [Planococcus glaciei]
MKTFRAFFAALDRASEAAGRKLYALPLLETKEVLYSELREQNLQEIHRILLAEKRPGVDSACRGYRFFQPLRPSAAGRADNL